MRTRTTIALGLAATLTLGVQATASAQQTCTDTGTGMTANHVNEVPDGPVTVTCDVGVYLDRDVDVDGLEVNASEVDAPGTRYGVFVSSAEVDLANVTITSPADYARQFVGITYQDGATGQVRDALVEGAHRAGILVRGSGTDLDIRNTDLVGIGPKTTGWAQNGLQVDDDATAALAFSRVEGHYWAKNDFVSSGILAFDGGVVDAHHTVVRNNDANLVLFSDGNKVAHNEVEVTVETTDPTTGDPTLQYGTLVSGADNHLAHNSFSAVAGDVGIYIFPGSANTKLIRNSINAGWTQAVSDNGTGTRRPNPVT